MSTYIPLRTSLKLHFKIDVLTKENRTLKNKIEELQKELDEYYKKEQIEEKDISKKVSVKEVLYCDSDCCGCYGSTNYKGDNCWYSRRVFIVDNI